MNYLYNYKHCYRRFLFNWFYWSHSRSVHIPQSIIFQDLLEQNFYWSDALPANRIRDWVQLLLWKC